MYAVPTYLGTTGRRRQVLLDLWCPCPSFVQMWRRATEVPRHLGSSAGRVRYNGGTEVGTLPPGLYDKILWVLVSP